VFVLNRGGYVKQALYQDSSTITGPLQPTKTVSYRSSLSLADRQSLVIYMLTVLITSSIFVWYLLRAVTHSGLGLFIAFAAGMMVLMELIRLVQSLTLFFFAYAAKDPIPMVPRSGLRVAVLTTIVPSKEPFSLVAQTLREMKHIDKVNGARVDVWLLDEGNQPAIRARCEAMGVKYFSRKGLAGWNTDGGSFKARTKHGNHNAWRRANERNYDVVAQMDPDHVPRRDFLERTLGYFSDPTVAFVVAPQVYGNLKDNWIARASAFQAYVFHGIIQRGGNGLQAPLLIGTNHLYRTEAFSQINGYQDSIIEDHLTSMVLAGAKNAAGKPWTGVYTPDIIAVGEGPVSFTDYFNQQKRWAYGIWDIAIKSTRGCLKKMNKRQGLVFLMLQFFYPSVAVSWVLSSLTTLCLSLDAIAYHGVTSVVAVLWLYSIASSLAMFFWMRKFNLEDHERRDWGLGGMALLLMCIPVYVSAGWQALRRKPLTYAVTAKGNLSSPDSLKTFAPQLGWLVAYSAGLGLIWLAGGTIVGANTFWLFEHMAICAAPIVVYAYQYAVPRLRHRLQVFRQATKQIVASTSPTLPELSHE
jgi:cellulose synthase (UDP-forming)